MFKKAPKLSTFSALSASRIIAHKRSGNALVYLTQNGEAFFLTFGEIVHSHTGSQFKFIAEKALSLEEVQDVLINIFNITPSGDVSGVSSEEKTDIILLESAGPIVTAYPEFVKVFAVESPYFSTKDIFLSVQKTRGPNTK